MKATGQTTTGNQIKVVFRNEDPRPQSREQIISSRMEKSLERESGALKELENLVGLDEVKKLVYEIYAFLTIRRLREEQGLRNAPHMFHMVFRGNPGTGKTTVARILGKLFKDMGVLEKGHLVEVERADLVGEYIGHTASKTRDIIKKALGGVLFIDEAYSLVRGGEKDFGKECIDTLIKSLEDDRKQLIVILAGYNEEMDSFLASNPGLPSRFPIKLDFPDYTIQQLLDIADTMCKDQVYYLSPEARQLVRKQLTGEREDGSDYFSNARFVRNMIEKAIRQQAIRIVTNHAEHQVNREMLMELKAGDFEKE
ncbi:AAA family ATPase [Aneurinibacillus migulanus]|uniref:ATPase AAA n=1 Tax=Aneurinibacillus migulanus TaxID=47500 RepID=A0A0D1UXF2_ANEMI|nr:AAA family ATPase [Aneurinibacillus migulanus]KIV51759.1 ATPase AAA [Aneurinibacillus migulanus]KON97875.1 ATPase AAA [Aneurinibacillus migulanus]MED0891109.1 AAA family ATPase [Aneurinibacillus migulanus]MED1614203.1 AAA family ATPase [Aneurinibacillus migulanus]SDH96740.1 stage V sporulation protein K [Aneurinibacillus migulanus]